MRLVAQMISSGNILGARIPMDSSLVVIETDLTRIVNGLQ